MFFTANRRTSQGRLSSVVLFIAAGTQAAPVNMILEQVAQIDHARILQVADAALKMEPVTITRFHAKLSEGGPNDFYYNGDYWWPDPSKTNGLPYLQRDGQTNPNNFIFHRQLVRQLSDAVAALGAACKITGDDHYVKKTVGFSSTGFVLSQLILRLCRGRCGRRSKTVKMPISGPNPYFEMVPRL